MYCTHDDLNRTYKIYEQNLPTTNFVANLTDVKLDRDAVWKQFEKSIKFLVVVYRYEPILPKFEQRYSQNTERTNSQKHFLVDIHCE